MGLMIRYKYIGSDPALAGKTALGITAADVFKVQVDKLNHPWSHGWHETDKKDWVVFTEKDSDDKAA